MSPADAAALTAAIAIIVITAAIAVLEWQGPRP